MSHYSNKLTTVLISTFIFWGCTHRSNQRYQPLETSKTKPTETLTTSPSPDSDNDVQEEQPLINAKSFLEIELKTTQALSKESERLYEHLKLSSRPEAYSVEEAALTIGLLKTALYPKNAAPILEENLYSDENVEEDSPKTTMSLEEESLKLGLNLVEVFDKNIYLGSYLANKLLVDVVSVSNDSPEYKELINNTFKTKSLSWAETAAALGFSPAATVATQNDAFPEEDTSKVSTSNLRIADFKNADELLLNSQTLAENGDYKTAIEKAALIEEGTPLFDSAQEKIRHYSNRAVRELRQKAALAFQSAAPIDELTVKIDYLMQAKQYLEEAVASFPAADQLTTVRENLAVITRDLERAQEEQKVEEEKQVDQ